MQPNSETKARRQERLLAALNNFLTVEDSTADAERTATATPDRFGAWTPDTDIGAELEKGGFRRAIAGTDFDRLVRAAQLVRDGAYRGIILHGIPGSGKSLAASILRHGLLDFVPGNGGDGVKYPEAATRIDCVNLPLFDKDERNAVCRADGLSFWIEDMGIENPVNDYGVRVDPIAMFLSNLRPDARCIITANLEHRDPVSGAVVQPFDAVRTRYGDRSASRLCDGFIWIRFSSGDHRASRMLVL